MKSQRNEFGKRLRALRKEKGMTLVELADEISCSVTTLSAVERGLLPPSRSILALLPSVLEHSGADLWALAAADYGMLYTGTDTPDALVAEAAKILWFGSKKLRGSPEALAPAKIPVVGDPLDYAIGSDAPLRCPGCDSENLHHDRVEVFERTEDAERGLHAVVTHDSITTDTSMAGNPSSRRQGLTIHLWCECCPVRSVLRVSQHKGSTFVDIAKEHYV